MKIDLVTTSERSRIMRAARDPAQSKDPYPIRARCPASRAFRDRLP